jgi:2'-5' RNA ligase
VARVFFAVWPDEPAAAALSRVAAEGRQACGGRAMRQDSLHLTLAFLGDLPAGRLLEARRSADELLADARPAAFTLTLDRLAHWRHNRILWAGGQSPALTALADGLCRRLREAGFRLDDRPFTAHLTLLRDARCPAPPPPVEPVAWLVREFVLAESALSPAGAHYRAIGRWPLA